MMKITLVYPRGMTVYGQEDFKEVYGLLSLAAVLRNGGYRVELADMFFMPLSEGDEFPVELLQAIQGADLVGFSLTGVLQLYWTQRIIGYLRAERNKVFLVAGGVLPTYAPAEALGALTDLDCIIRGEGEESLLALAQALEHRTDWQGIPGVCFKRQDGLIIRPAAPLIADLDRLPFIARDYLRQALGHGNPASVLTSRGCWSKCTFCNSHLLAKLSGGKKRRVRSGENVLRELDYLWERDQVNHIQFADDTLAGPGPAERERLFKIADGMIGSGRNYRFFAEIRTDVIDDRIIRRLVDAGLYDICIGIESWSQSQLDRLGKMTTVAANRRAMEIVIRYPIRNVRIGSLFFDAGVTINELRTQIDNMSQYPQFEVARCKNKVSVYPGALEVRKLQDAGLLYGDWLQYDYRFVC